MFPLAAPRGEERPASSFGSPPRGIFVSAAPHIHPFHLGTLDTKMSLPLRLRVAPCGPLLTRRPPSRGESTVRQRHSGCRSLRRRFALLAATAAPLLAAPCSRRASTRAVAAPARVASPAISTISSSRAPRIARHASRFSSKPQIGSRARTATRPVRESRLKCHLLSGRRTHSVTPTRH